MTNRICSTARLFIKQSVLRVFTAGLLSLCTLPLLAYGSEFTWVSGPLNHLESWQDSEGHTPDSFEMDSQVFTISDPQNEEAIEADNDWMLSGADTRLIIDTDEDLVFAEETVFTLDGITVEFTENAGGDLVLKGDMAIVNGVEWVYDDAGDVWSFDYRDDGDQALMSDGTSYLLVYNFRSQKDDGSFDLISLHPEEEEVTVLRTLNNFRTRYREDALFSDRGNRIIIGDDVRIIGEHDSYLFTGTIEHRVFDGNSDYEEVEADLNNLIIVARNDGNPRFRNNEEYTQNIVIKGDFTVDMYTEGDIEFNDVRLEVRGDVRMSHTRPAGTDGDSEIDLDESEFIVGGDFTLVLSKKEADGDENIDVDDAHITIGGNLYVYVEQNGEFDLDDALIRVVEGHAVFEASENAIIDFDNGMLIVNGDLSISADHSSEIDFDDSHIHVSGDFSVHFEPGITIDADEFTLRYYGPNDQNIDLSSLMVLHNLEIYKPEGHVALKNNIIASSILFQLGEDASFDDEGNTMQILDLIAMEGSQSLYSLSGTIVLAERTEEEAEKSISFNNNLVASEDEDGVIRFDYKQLGMNAVSFHLFSELPMGETPAEPIATFNLDERNAEASAEVFFENDSPTLTFRQNTSGSGPVEISNLVWYLPGEERDDDDDEVTTDSQVDPELPTEASLNQNYPNPFNPTTVISFEIPQTQQVTLEVYDVNGRLVETLVNEQRSPGSHQVSWDAGHLSSGLYLYKLQAGSTMLTRTMMLVK
ncbi:T9SS type A sorting domain-containing protein [Balneolaceae bacterium ANBcel3]|nr:T9SS type A sorting domain-containing protein [Balneolaceae bacterium ANBcel3]